MTFVAIVALALAMSTDAFAAAIGKGAALHRPRWSEALRTGLIFGAIESLTPVVGYVLRENRAMRELAQHVGFVADAEAPDANAVRLVMTLAAAAPSP